MLNMQGKKCHNINLVSPSHIVPQITEAILIAAQNGLNIPIVYNTNGYDLTDTLRLLDGIVDVFMPDIKFFDDNIAEKYLDVKNYYKIAKAAAKEISIDTYVNLMAQYYPVHKSFEFAELPRRISRQEYQYAITCAKSVGLKIIKG